MKINNNFLLTAITIAALCVSSCKKDEGALPNIAFKKDLGYAYLSDTVHLGDTLMVGINASKAEDKDVLKSFEATQINYDSMGAKQPTMSLYSESLTGSNEDQYSKDFMIIPNYVNGKERHIFSVVNRDGLKNSIYIELTVLP